MDRRYSHLPRILVIDDVYGRQVGADEHIDRTSICVLLRLIDETGDVASRVDIRDPLARAVFCRGQLPVHAAIGDVVENDLPGTLSVIDKGWHARPRLPRQYPAPVIVCPASRR